MFVSHAQNFEDVLLWRALKNVSRGTYVDVGASHPHIDSVTFAFYERGWHGVNIEPVVADHALLQEFRPCDVNLLVAAGAEPATLPLYQFGVRGLATLSEVVTERHRKSGLVANATNVPVMPLRDICAQHITGEIHFLKIDVEGSEAAVLRGMDFSRWRPWILLIEATLPNSQEPTHSEWEPYLLEQGYRYCYFDGLSRYYVAAEHYQLLSPALNCQPNVFDDFVLASVVRTKDSLLSAQRRLAESEHRWQHLTDGLGVRSQILELQREVDRISTELTAARDAWASAESAYKGARRTISDLQEQIELLKSDIYFRAGTTVRSFARRLSGRKARHVS